MWTLLCRLLLPLNLCFSPLPLTHTSHTYIIHFHAKTQPSHNLLINTINMECAKLSTASCRIRHIPPSPTCQSPNPNHNVHFDILSQGASVAPSTCQHSHGTRHWYMAFNECMKAIKQNLLFIHRLTHLEYGTITTIAATTTTPYVEQHNIVFGILWLLRVTYSHRQAMATTPSCRTQNSVCGP